jgi:hypothetical protein
MRSIPLLSRVDTVKRVSRIAEEFHLVSNSSESSTEYRCKFSLKSALQYEIAFNLTHPRGFRELRSNAEMRKLLNRKIAAQNRKCGICEEAFTSYNDIVPDHINPKGMGGAWRDDHPDNIQAVHWWCNGEKGSSRI